MLQFIWYIRSFNHSSLCFFAGYWVTFSQSSGWYISCCSLAGSWRCSACSSRELADWRWFFHLSCVIYFLFWYITIRSKVHWYSFDLERTQLKPILQSYLDCLSILLVEPHDGKKSDLKEEELPYDSKAPTKHVISRDLQVQYLRMKLCKLYWEKSFIPFSFAALLRENNWPYLEQVWVYSI